MASARTWMVALAMLVAYTAFVPNAVADNNLCNIDPGESECTFHCHAGQQLAVFVYSYIGQPTHLYGTVSCGGTFAWCEEQNAEVCAALVPGVLPGEGRCTKIHGDYARCSAAGT